MRRTCTFGVRRKRLRSACRCSASVSAATYCSRRPIRRPAEIADARADFEHRVAQVRPQHARQPAQVLRRAGEIVEHAAAVRRRVEIVDQPELKITPSAFSPSRQPIFLPSS